MYRWWILWTRLRHNHCPNGREILHCFARSCVPIVRDLKLPNQTPVFLSQYYSNNIMTIRMIIMIRIIVKKKENRKNREEDQNHPFKLTWSLPYIFKPFVADLVAQELGDVAQQGSVGGLLLDFRVGEDEVSQFLVDSLLL